MFTLEYSVAMETLYNLQVTSTCAFVANKVFEYILLNATTEIEALEFYYINKRKISYFFFKFHPQIYPTHQLRLNLEQYHQLSIISYDHFIVLSNWFCNLNAYLEYSQ